MTGVRTEGRGVPGAAPPSLIITRAGVAIALVLLAGITGCLGSAPSEEQTASSPIDARPAFPPEAAIGTTLLFARVQEPGYPEGILISDDRLYVSSAAFVESGLVPEYNLTIEELLREVAFDPPTRMRGWERGVLGITSDRPARVYVTVLGVPTGSHGISVLDRDDEEQLFFPTVEENEAQEIPYDGPATIVFHDAHRSTLVTNLAQSEPDQWAVLEAYVDDTGPPLHRPSLPDGGTG